MVEKTIVLFKKNRIQNVLYVTEGGGLFILIQELSGQYVVDHVAAVNGTGS